MVYFFLHLNCRRKLVVGKVHNNIIGMMRMFFFSSFFLLCLESWELSTYKNYIFALQIKMQSWWSHKQCSIKHRLVNFRSMYNLKTTCGLHEYSLYVHLFNNNCFVQSIHWFWFSTYIETEEIVNHYKSNSQWLLS
jgi:hypothetical protein